MAARRLPALRELEDLRSSCPEGGTAAGPALTTQLEYDVEPPLYLTLAERELGAYARALAHAWRLSGTRRGDVVAVYDYGTSPLAYLASASFTPHLRRGAAEHLGCVPICNDGVSQMAGRAVEIARFVRPSLWVVRCDCLPPFAGELERQGVALHRAAAALLAAENEGVLAEEHRRRLEDRLGVPVRRLLRVDAALLVAAECPVCSLFHVPHDLYRLEVRAPDRAPDREPGREPDRATGREPDRAPDREPGLPQETGCGAGPRGRLVVTCRFARPWGPVRYLSQVGAVLHPGGCPRGPDDLRFGV